MFESISNGQTSSRAHSPSAAIVFTVELRKTHSGHCQERLPLNGAPISSVIDHATWLTDEEWPAYSWLPTFPLQVFLSRNRAALLDFEEPPHTTS